MACEKHILRKRPKTCPDCAAEIGFTMVEVHEVPDVVEAIIPELPTVEEISEEVRTVIGQFISSPAIVEEPVFVESTTPYDLDEYIDFKRDEYIKLIDDTFQAKFKEMKKEIAGLFKIKYEHLDISLSKFNIKLMEQLSKDGWKMIHILTKEAARVSGLKEDSVILQRIICPDWKYTLEQYKEKYKGTV